MMKLKKDKLFCAIICALIFAILSGCGTNDISTFPGVSSTQSQSNEISNKNDEDMVITKSDQSKTTVESKTQQNTDSEKGSDGTVDVDLTALSSTMVYSEVYNMLYKPEDYVGKMIKMDGTFTAYHDKNSGKTYYACIIQDATACCSQGMEFILNDTYSYPDDYPKEGDTICVVGEFDTYQEDGGTYCTLKNASMI